MDKDKQTNIEEQETSATDASLNTEEQEDKREGGEDKRIPYERFKQKVDEVNELREKLAQIEEEQAQAKRQELEEQERYKELYEQALQEKEEARQEALSLRKTSLLKSEGYNDEQAKLFAKLIEGDDEESIAESIKRIKATVPITDNYADPSTFNGRAAKPKEIGAEDIAQKQFERIKDKLFR